MFNKHQCTEGPFSGKCGTFNRNWGHWAHKMQGHRRVPANIEETDQQYVISLCAAGLSKEAITLQVKDDILTVTYKGAQGSDAQSFTHQEHSQASFERSFLLNGRVATENISATYADGILKITLPKTPEAAKPAQSINVD